jgi:hypothetical protein
LKKFLKSLVDYIKSMSHVYFFVLIVAVLTLFRSHIDGMEFESIPESSESIVLTFANETILNEQSNACPAPHTEIDYKSIPVATDKDDLEVSYAKLEKTFKEFEIEARESESLFKEIKEFINETNASKRPSVKVNQNKVKLVPEESQTYLDSNTGKITTTIRVNSFMTIKSTIVTGGKFFSKTMDKNDNKLAEATFDIDIPQLDINVSVSTDIVFDSENYAKMKSN